MPIYEYKCMDCGSHFEKMQKVSDDQLTICEKCNGRLEKQWSLSGFQFKGEGWYLTDYSNKGKPDSKSGASSEKSDASSEKVGVSESTKTETPASKDSGGNTAPKSD